VRPLADATIAFYEDDRQTLIGLLPQLGGLVESAPGSTASLIAAFYFYLDETDKGFEWLERSFFRGEDISSITYDPDFDGIRTDPRYLNLLKRLGLGQTAQPAS
jgi:hypothetical protein